MLVKPEPGFPVLDIGRQLDGFEIELRSSFFFKRPVKGLAHLRLKTVANILSERLSSTGATSPALSSAELASEHHLVGPSLRVLVPGVLACPFVKQGRLFVVVLQPLQAPDLTLCQANIIVVVSDASGYQVQCHTGA